LSVSLSLDFGRDTFDVPDPSGFSGWYAVHRRPFTLYAKGSLLLPPFAIGEESLHALADRLATENLDDLLAKCEGIFGLILFNKLTAT